MSGWTHLWCEDCWWAAGPGRGPTRVKDDPPRPCCHCGNTTESGIYVRTDPSFSRCKGDGPVHDEKEANAQ